MKKRFLLFGLISLILSFTAQSQVVIKYQQGFEGTGTDVAAGNQYHIASGTCLTQSTLHSSGASALMMSHTATTAQIYTDTIDFTDNGSFQYFVLEFMHICDVDPTTGQQADNCATIEAKRVDQSAWTSLSGNTHYDRTWGGGSEDFASTSSFSKESYTLWRTGTINNTWWKKERFNLGSFFQGVSLSSRKLIIRVTLHPRTIAGTDNTGWYLDAITVKASTQSLAPPILTMVSYPDLISYPSSRSTRIDTKITTPVTQGLAADSIYIQYQLGTNLPIQRTRMNAVAGVANLYRAYIPFCGYDTIVHYRVVVKDATTNHNTATFPTDASAWETYKSVRGYANNVALSQTVSNGPDFPFPSKADSRSQVVYDRQTLAAAGYKPGAITGFSFTAGSACSNAQRNGFQIKMANVDTSFIISTTNSASNIRYYTGNMKIVYDSTLRLTQNPNTLGTINLQDTFFYAGKDIVMTITYNNTSDPAGLSVKSFATATNKQSVHTELEGSYGIDPFQNTLFSVGSISLVRPNYVFRSLANLPLLYDCGISGFIAPNDSTSADAGTANNVVLTLHNYGARPINAVRIWYKVDDSAAVHYDWSGTLAGGSSVNVIVNSNQYYTHGYHEMRAWVGDSVTVAGSLYRDHEPLNDTLWTRFVACLGPMHDSVTVGSAGSDYASMSRFLYTLSQCGVDGPLRVKLAPGTYTPITMPLVPGTSATNYVQFEPADGSATSVMFRPATTNGSTTISLIDLRTSNHIRFYKINFSSNASTFPVTYLARLGTSSTGCQFLRCNFTEVRGTTSGVQTYTAADALIYSGGADSTLVDGCSFSRGTIGVSMVGPASDNMAHGTQVVHSSFANQGNNALVIRNQVAAVVDSNTMNDVLTNASYVLLLQDCSGATRISRNKIYVTTGASCIGATEFAGSASGYAVISNNMLISNDNGISNMLTTPLNVITASYTKVIYNSVRMMAPTRSGIAAATLGGGTIGNCYFLNNIAACADTSNYAFNYIPNAGGVNYIGYNIYYSLSTLLNKYDGINCTSLSAWQSHCVQDVNSQNVNPSFLLSTTTDLRSYSQNVKSHGAPVVEVSNDMFGTARNSTEPCVGAFEFLAIPYDFEVLDLQEPYSEYCNVPTEAPLRVVIKNSGINTFTPGTSGTLTLTYSRTTQPGVMSPANSGNIIVNRPIPGSDTIIFNTGVNLSFPTNGFLDSTYKFYFWLTSTIDPNPANDTSNFDVTAHYHAPAPDSISLMINYGTAPTINITGGLQNWYSNVFSSGRVQRSTAYWYNDPLSTTSFYRGNTYTSNILYHDTSFYIRQKRDLPLVKITEVQIKNNGIGVTYPQPLYMNSGTTLAVELTNVGDYPADMEGDTLLVISANTNGTPNGSFNNRIYCFPRITIQPGQNIVLQYRTGINNIDSTKTLGAMMNLSPTNTTNFAILYKDGMGVVDGVAFNSMPPTSGTVWSDNDIPPSVWSGNGISLDALTAGVTRIGWPSDPSATPSNTAQYWRVADSTHSMTLGSTNQNLIRYTDNGCIGDVAPVRVHINVRPLVDLALDSITLPSGCGLSTENIVANIHNYGLQPSGSFVAKYSINGVLQCSDTIITGVPSSGAVTHTFSQPANFYVAGTSTIFNVRVWVDHLTNDNTPFNDTTSLSIESRYTPAAPNVPMYDTVPYATRAIITGIGPVLDSLAWYDRHMDPLDTVNVFTSDYLYTNDTFYVTAFGPVLNYYNVGTLESLTSATGYPSPYNPNKKYVKEQYLYTAADLIASGHSAGPITALSFYLDTIMVNTGTMTFSNYKVYIGSTTNETFSSNNDWQTVSEVFSDSLYTLTNSNRGWVTHNFSTPFQWDGTSNIVVQIVRSIDPAITQGAKTRYTSVGANKVLFKNDNVTTDMEAFLGNGSRSANRPDIRFGFVDYGCEGPSSPVYVAVVGAPASDAGLEWSANIDTVRYSSCGPTNFNVVVRNGGLSSISNYSIHYWVDTTHDTFTGITTIVPGDTAQMTIATPILTPGRHTLKAVISAFNDTTSVNDTISRIINVSFCAGIYTVGSDSTADYRNFTTVLDTLSYAGVAGPVVFSVQSGTYNEQLSIGSYTGVSAINTITFRSASGNSDSVILRYAPTNINNYVLQLTGTNNISFEHITIYAAGAGNYSNAVVLSNAEDIHFTGVNIRVKGTINNPNASCIIVNDNVYSLYIDSCVVDSGFYSVKTEISTLGVSANMYFNDNQFLNFWSQGIFLRKVDEVYIKRNTVRSGVNVSGRALTGITVAESNTAVNIERNNVVLYDGKNGGKRSIVLLSCSADNVIRSKVYNNMCVAHGTGTSGQVSAGIYIDSCVYMNVYYNSIRVYAGVNSNATRAFSVDHNSSNIYVLNNIFANFSKGYSYWINSLANVSVSNYNVFFSDTATSSKRLARIGSSELPTIDTLRFTSGQDVNSLFDMPYYHADDNLHLEFGLYTEKAQYNTDVPTDIDGDIRPQIPSPTIGADEYIRCTHNIAIMQFLEPTLDSNTVESDTLRVVVKLYNDGTSTETNLTWYANIVDHTNLRTQDRYIDEILPGRVIFDTAYIILPIGLIDTQHIVAHFPMGNDCITTNNTVDTVFFLEPAFNIKAAYITVDNGTGCRLHSTPISITLTNVGRKAIPAANPLIIGYQALLNTTGITVAQLPLVHTETALLPEDLPINASVTLNFAQNANLYPTGNAKDVSIRVRGWQTYVYDQKPLDIGNDTTSYTNVTSKFTPSRPIGDDLHIPYATWDTIFASQTDNPPTGSTLHFPIRWYRDSLDAEPYFASSNYTRSCWWKTPQYFRDTTYFLSCISSTGCTSYYNPIHVYINPRVSVDAGVVGITEPYSKVFMNNDTVKAQIINYGSQPITNIPVTYQFRREGNNTPILQQVTETCHAIIAPDSIYLFKFDSLLTIPVENVPYTIRCWTDHPNELVRLNDSMRYDTSFTPLPESHYCNPSISNKEGLDIVRVSFSSLDNVVSEVGNDYINFGSFTTPIVQPLNLIKGTTDTMTFEVANSDSYSDYSSLGYLTVFVDYNRNGVFEDNTDSTYHEIIYQDTVHSRIPKKIVYTIPSNICLGYMRMRVVVEQDGTHHASGCPGFPFGQVQDYLLHIEDVPAVVDATPSRIVSPRNPIIESDTTRISFMLTNKGSSTIQSANIAFRCINSSDMNENLMWTGNLLPGHSEPISLPARHFPQGTTNVTISVEVPGDTITSNDTLWYQYHRFKTITLILNDSFEGPDIWYAPRGYNSYSENLWQRGYPVKPHIASVVSDSNVWATNLTGMVSCTERGNLSFLYTPYIDISQVRPDTISFWMASSLGDSSYVTVQYYDYLDRWITIGSANDPMWYNNGLGFTGSSSGYSYINYKFPTASLSSDFQQRLQFRFVFHARPGVVVDDGVAIDNVVIGRARRAVDVGIIAITHPTHPKFGQTIYPKVALHNFGYDTVRSASLAYRPYGTSLAMVGTYTGELAPGATALYQFPDGFTVMNTFPDTFQICAYTTVNLDIYWENDSLCKDFYLSPLDNDMGIAGFISPIDHIVAGDSVQVTVRLRNYGQAPVASTTVSYVYNSNFIVTEELNFNDLIGHDLQSFEYFNYTFHQKFRASMGAMRLVSYTQMPNDDYLYNDTVSKSLVGLSAITDLKATAVVVDNSAYGSVVLQLVIDNIGARSANDFDVGLWYDNDTTTLMTGVYHRASPLAALDRGFFSFDTLQERAAGYDYVTAYVHINNDNDLTNDTTSLIMPASYDLRARRVLVQENREDTCRVRLEMENIGNLSFSRSCPITATVNGTTINTTCNQTINPGEIYTIDFHQSIPKSPTREYVGSGTIMAPITDANAANNQTSIVDVQNYFGIPFVSAANGMVLEQNYPNPYNSTTRIDFYIPTSGKVRFFVMDEMGRLVYQSSNSYAAGDNSINFSDSHLASGIYYYGIEMNENRLMRKMVYKK